MEPDEGKVFVDGVILLLHPYVEAVVIELYPIMNAREKKKVSIQTERIHRLLLEKFWLLSQADAKISMFMIPILTYLRRAVRQKQQTALKALPLNN